MIRIRNMTGEDLKRVAGIEAENFSVPWTEKDFQDFLNREDTIFLVAEEDGKAAGYIGAVCSAEEGDITNVSVSEENRRKGIGTALVRELVRRTEEKGISRLFLEVREKNKTAVRLYEKAGFSPVGRRRKYYRDPQEDAVVMKRGG